MRTKTLILTVALSAAGIATSLAQVYSVNAVGYVNVTIPNNFSMLAQPFVVGTNTLNAVLNPNEMPNAGIGVAFYKFVNGNFNISAVDPIVGGTWYDDQGMPNGDIETLDFGHGALILNQTGNPFVKTFVGEVAQNNPPATPISNPIPIGYSIRSSKVPQAGGIQSALAFPTTAGDQVLKFNPTIQNFETYANDPLGGGTAAEWYLGPTQIEPTLAIAESMLVLKVDNSDWVRSFTVN